ncbi:MAG: nitrogenase iron-molybdenum cofactor biosynthesis protein NifN [Magnetococcales bacterium]|nr:nitrogenase iron-molybdenum cofactor biosynthesis protein NifN [Magnetococcales bacterium]
MARVIKRHKAVSVRPLKTGQPTGAVLAFQGIRHAIPMLHGSQGCSAFTKVFFVRHFREPIPLQTTAMDPISAVMGGTGNVITGLETLAKAGKARVIGLITTGLTEVQGVDLQGVVEQFRNSHSGLAGKVTVVGVHAADFSGCLENGYAQAVLGMIQTLVPEHRDTLRNAGGVSYVNVLPGAHLTPGDVDVLKAYITAFGLHPLVLPDLSSALDGHIPESLSSPVSVGGTTWEEMTHMPRALATLVVGSAMRRAAEDLEARTGIPTHYCQGLMGVEALDQLVSLLIGLSGRPVPAWIERDRSRLLDAMMDTHFTLSGRRLGLAGDPDWLLQWHGMLVEMGLDTPVVVASTQSQALSQSGFETVKIGDLEDLEDMVTGLDTNQRPHALVGNSHVAEVAGRLRLPVIRSGYPLFDWIGGHARAWIGYEGTRQVFYDLANAITHSGVPKHHPFRSRFSTFPEKEPK